MRIIIFVIGFFFICSLQGISQVKDSVTFLEIIENNGDTLPHVELDEIPIFPRKFSSRKDERKYGRLLAKVKKVYPYAKIAAELLGEYDERYQSTNDSKLRRKYVKEAESKLFDQYGTQLKKLTISEGRILIKLIDRETEHTSYELIKDLKGGLSAFFWQGIAKIFGNNLKDEYDPVTEDRMIEEIIIFIEAGVI